MTLPSRVACIGEGLPLWLALDAIRSESIRTGEPVQVVHLAGTSGRVIPPGRIVAQPERIAGALAPWSEVELGIRDTVREYRNQAFRRMTPARRESVWDPEQVWILKPQEGIGAMVPSPSILLERLRARVMAWEGYIDCSRKQLVEIRKQDQLIVFAGGESFKWDWIFDADGQSRSKRGETAYSALQLELTHPASMKFDAFPEEQFLLELSRESGETRDRRVLGYFLEGSPVRSVWTVFFTHEEGMDNHLIMKRLRRLKQALNKAFHEEPWVSAGKDFISAVQRERFTWVERGGSSHPGACEHRVTPQGSSWSWDAQAPWWETWSKVSEGLRSELEEFFAPREEAEQSTLTLEWEGAESAQDVADSSDQIVSN